VLLKTNKKTYKVLHAAAPYVQNWPKEKCAFPNEKVCVVWETWRGVNGRGGYRVERERYPNERVPAYKVALQPAMHNGRGRVTEDTPNIKT